MWGILTTDNWTPAGNGGIIKWQISTDLHSSQSASIAECNGCGTTSRTTTSLDHPWRFPAATARHCCCSRLMRRRVSAFRFVSQLHPAPLRWSLLAGLLAGCPLAASQNQCYCPPCRLHRRNNNREKIDFIYSIIVYIFDNRFSRKKDFNIPN